ncbi:MAG: protein translocase subunit SecDF [Bacteroidia bacterium]|nr:MAG: protein translocase subunit SecDF [Bacteroidia bacterium]
MQNKGIITFLAVLLGIASIFQLSFTYTTWRVKQKARTYATDAGGNIDYNKEQSYLDSMANKDVYLFSAYTFKECQEREMNLGLDLRGGMNVILEVSVADLILNLSDNSRDSVFLASIAKAKAMQAESQDNFVDLFYQAFKATDPQARLSSIFSTYALKDRVKFETSDEDVLKVIREEAQDAIDNSLNVLRSRIDKFGVVQPSIQKLEGGNGRILIELPGVKEPQRVRKLLQGTANLQFWETYTFPELYSNFASANERLKSINDLKKEPADTSSISSEEAPLLSEKTRDTLTNLQDSLSSEESLLATTEDSTDVGSLIEGNNNELKEQEGFEEFKRKNPLFAVLRPYVNEKGMPISSAAVGFAHVQDTAKVNQILNMPQIKSLFPKELRLKWDVKPFDENAVQFRLVALKAKRAGKPSLEGDVIVKAREETDPNTGEWQVSMTMNAEGASKWAMITKENKGRQVAIVLDNRVYSYPNVNDEIKGGRSSISGNFSQTEAKDLANILKSGKLQAPAVIIEEEVVGPSLGQQAVNNGMTSFLIAFIVVLLYMIFFYKFAGIVADIALIVNVFLIFGVLASFRAVLTLPGIAGIVLTIGMSVDANVLIYERIKEELRLGKGLKMALHDGYKNAYSAIIDANITTLITGIILFIFGHGPIKGFATTLIIGILTSLFSAIFITRLVFIARMNSNKSISFYTKFTENAFQNIKINFIGKRKVAYIISGIFITAGLISLFTKGLNLGVDFQGGRTYVVKFDKPVKTSAVAKALTVGLGETPEVKTYGSTDQVKIVTKFMVKSTDPKADDLAEQKIFESLQSAKLLEKEITQNLFVEGFVLGAEGKIRAANAGDDDKSVMGIKSSRKVGPTIADDIKVAALWAIFFSLIAIFIYIFIRFRNWQFGLGAVAALFHDVLFVLGAFSFLYNIMPFSMEINQAFIAALLTVVGYSVNDTVVVFDRIREYLKFSKTREKQPLYNSALNSTLSRTFNTSLSTFVVLLAIFFFGGEAIRGFIFALLLGVVVGTYSSLFIATPVVYDSVKKSKIKVEVTEKKKNRAYLGGKKKKNK